MNGKHTKKALLSFLKMKLATDDVWAVKALGRIYAAQTSDEIRQEATNHNNGIGFTGTDAQILTGIYKSYERYGRRMTPKMMSLVHKKMPKYAGQLYTAAYFDHDKMNAIYEKWLKAAVV